MNNKKFSPLLWVPSVYFAMGLPFVVLSLVLPVIFKDLNVPNADIVRWTSLLILPWSLKPVFSLVMETYGTKRQYVVLAEMVIAVMFGLVVFALPLPKFFVVALALMGVVAISGSVHDIAGDGIYLQELDKKTQSVYSGWQGAFYNLAKVFANGGLVFLAGWFSQSRGFSAVASWQMVMVLLAVLMFLVAVYHWRQLPKEKSAPSGGTFQEKSRELLQVFLEFFKKKHIWYYLAFIFLYRFAEGMATRVLPIFLKESVALGGLGLDNQQYGLVYGTVGTVAFIGGSILSGLLVARHGLKRVLFWLACAFNIPFVVYVLFAFYQPTNLLYVGIGIAFDHFGYGFGFVGLIVFMMQQIAPGKRQMAHYAFANSAMNLGVLVPGYLSADLMEFLSIGGAVLLNSIPQNLFSDGINVQYKLFFLLVMVATIPALIITWFVPFTYDDSRRKQVEDKRLA